MHDLCDKHVAHQWSMFPFPQLAITHPKHVLFPTAHSATARLNDAANANRGISSTTKGSVRNARLPVSSATSRCAPSVPTATTSRQKRPVWVRSLTNSPPECSKIDHCQTCAQFERRCLSCEDGYFPSGQECAGPCRARLTRRVSNAFLQLPEVLRGGVSDV